LGGWIEVALGVVGYIQTKSPVTQQLASDLDNQSAENAYQNH